MFLQRCLRFRLSWIIVYLLRCSVCSLPPPAGPTMLMLGADAPHVPPASFMTGKQLLFDEKDQRVFPKTPRCFSSLQT